MSNLHHDNLLRYQALMCLRCHSIILTCFYLFLAFFCQNLNRCKHFGVQTVFGSKIIVKHVIFKFLLKLSRINCFCLSNSFFCLINQVRVFPNNNYAKNWLRSWCKWLIKIKLHSLWKVHFSYVKKHTNSAVHSFLILKY